MKQALSQAGVSEDEIASLEYTQKQLESRPQNLIDFLRTIVKRFERLYIIIDGLDECENPDRDELLEARALFTCDNRVKRSDLSCQKHP